MRRQTAKLLVLSVILAVAPAAASQRLTAARHGPGCPHDAGRAVAAVSPSRGGGVIKLSLFGWLPSDGLSLGVGRTSGPFLP
jgi:hypothetical protein